MRSIKPPTNKTTHRQTNSHQNYVQADLEQALTINKHYSELLEELRQIGIIDNQSIKIKKIEALLSKVNINLQKELSVYQRYSMPIQLIELIEAEDLGNIECAISKYEELQEIDSAAKTHEELESKINYQQIYNQYAELQRSNSIKLQHSIQSRTILQNKVQKIKEQLSYSKNDLNAILSCNLTNQLKLRKLEKENLTVKNKNIQKYNGK